MPSTQILPIQIETHSGELLPGQLEVHIWAGKEGTWRSAKLTGKIFSRVLILCGVALLVHPLIIPSIITVILFFMTSPILFGYFAGQKATFIRAAGTCPFCAQLGNLNPYLWRTVGERITLLCPECGQTCRAQVELPLELKS